MGPLVPLYYLPVLFFSTSASVSSLPLFTRLLASVSSAAQPTELGKNLARHGKAAPIRTAPPAGSAAAIYSTDPPAGPADPAATPLTNATLGLTKFFVNRHQETRPAQITGPFNW